MRDGNRRKRQVWDKERILSTLIAVAVVATLVLGIFSVVKTVNRVGESGNVVNLNETKENVAIKIEEASEADLSDKVALGTDSKMYESESENELSNGSNNGKLGNEQGTSNVADNVNNKLGSDHGASGIADNAKVNQNEGIKGAQDGGNTETNMSGVDIAGMSKAANVAKPEQVAASVANYSFDEASSVIWPVTGDITLGFSMDNTTFFKTLGVYKCSQGIIISAAKGTKTAVAASGVVKDIVVSDETKTTITVAIGDGYETTYGLLDNITVKQGDVVTKGQLLGNVSEPSAYYKEEGPGVYFAMTRNGEPVDPEVYLEQ